MPRSTYFYSGIFFSSNDLISKMSQPTSFRQDCGIHAGMTRFFPLAEASC
jgi:hypothetical protein